MGYRALLFCPEEKLARVVTQVFTELDFSVEAVQEPFAAVKKLMAQRYDAVVVDCENEQNATLLFKSARNSSSNQNSLALALVEGQAGVAKAYRIGANLVLTKPINVEQAKGTLRVARGLLRKNAEPTAAGATPTVPKPAQIPAVTPTAALATVAPVLPGNVPEPPTFEMPAMVASAEEATLEPPVVAEMSKAPAESAKVQPTAPVPELPKPAAPTPTPIPTVNPVSVSHGAAAAPAPAREAPYPEKQRRVDPEFAQAAGSAPSFGTLEESATGQDSSGSKKLLAVAAVLLVAGAFGFYGWTKFGKSASTPPGPTPVVATSPSLPPSAAPASVTAQPATSANQLATSQPASASAGTQSTKPSATINSTSPARIALESVPAPKTPEPTPTPAPIRVKTQTSAANTAKPPAEEVATPVPNPLSVASATDKSISGLVTSTPTALPKQAPGTVKVSQGVSQGLLINRVQPKYPQNALAMRIQGSVQLEATISKEGKITNLKVTSGDPVLSKAATDAVRQWRYRPYYLDGLPVDIQTQITVNFKLPN